ncbi:Rhodanese-like domain-containing protein [Xylaria arbuscula]|nr:Rhodanese-like domain-containing protein [Xylaria arbuscula]
MMMSSISTRRIITSAARPALRSSSANAHAIASPAVVCLRATFSSTAIPRTTTVHAPRVAGRKQLGRLVDSSTPRLAGVRWSTTSATGSKIWSFEEIQSLATDPNPSSTPKVTLIDVREPGELKSTGKIPGALNIPITTSPDAFHLSPEDFEDRFGFAQPGKEDEVVFYCKAGVRSRAAAGIAREAGWTDVGEYPGSWVEWAGKGGKVER